MKKASVLFTILWLLKFTIIVANPYFNLSGVSTPSAILGYGYSHDNGQPTLTDCLNLGVPIYSGKNEGRVDYSQFYNYNDVKQQLRWSIGLDVGVGLFSVDATASFMHYIENDNLSESLIYRTFMKYKDKNAVPKVINGTYLNKDGRRQWRAGTTQFRQACGDAYVGQIHYGAYLYIVFQLHFTNAIDKQRFDAQFSAAYGDFFSLEAKMSSWKNTENLQGNIHIMAYQVGGDPSQLGTIFKSKQPWQPSSLTQCSFQDMSACSQVMEGILTYINTTFPKQFSVMDDQGGIPKLAAPMGIEQQDYSNLNPKYKTSSRLTDAIRNARNNLGNLLEMTYDHLNRGEYVQQLINNEPFVYDNYKNRLKNYLNLLNDNIQLLENGGKNCFSKLDTCLQIEKMTLANLKPDNTNTLSLPEKIEVTEIDNRGKQKQLLFVLRSNFLSSPQLQTFYGIQLIPKHSNAKYDLTVQLNQSTIIMLLNDHDTGKAIAEYQGQLMSIDHYQGSIIFAAGGSGKWKSVMTPTSALSYRE